MPLKSVKRGFKLWVVADSTNVYFLDVQVYIGREGAATEHGLGERVVLGVDRKVSGEKPPRLL